MLSITPWWRLRYLSGSLRSYRVLHKFKVLSSPRMRQDSCHNCREREWAVRLKWPLWCKLLQQGTGSLAHRSGCSLEYPCEPVLASPFRDSSNVQEYVRSGRWWSKGSQEVYTSRSTKFQFSLSQLSKTGPTLEETVSGFSTVPAKENIISEACQCLPG